MKTILLVALLFALLPGSAHGQCQIQTFTNYGVSYSEVLNSTGTDIISSVVVDGSASMQIQSGCPVSSMYQQFQNELPYITHYPSVLNQVGSVGGWTAAPSICAECYLSFQSNTDSGPVNPGQQLNFSYGGQVYCSTAGIVFSTNGSNYLERAGTYDQATGAGTPDGTFAGEPVYIYHVVHYCTNGTPDYNPSTLDVNEPNAATDRYFFATAVLFRFSQTSTWSVLWPTGGATTYGGSQKVGPPTLCTHTGPQK